MHEFIDTIPSNEMYIHLRGVVLNCKTCLNCSLTIINRFEDGVNFYFLNGKMLVGFESSVKTYTCDEIIIKGIIE